MTRSRTSSDEPTELTAEPSRALVIVKALPGVLGAALVCLGIAAVYWPAAVAAAGVFLLLLDRRL